ncbi:MAG: substrate-binding domain-containing protein [Scytonema sp. PMC 1069.18]|nr:substrate-binding domain-containing protein [Scytonema sp. PMC 1069.18]MEC4882058.1 substrate-binding domain-containing protein [Scytonema sp. PMC 1070.18]
MSTNKSKNKEFIECSYCNYNANPSNAQYCQKCGKSLITANLQNSHQDVKLQTSVPQIYKWLSLPLNWVGFTLLLPLIVLIVGSYFFLKTISTPDISSNTEVVNSIDKPQSSSSDIKYYNSIKEVANVPEGIFYYGGALVFATLTAQGTHEAINQAHPNFQLRYSEPMNDKPGSNTGVAMLLKGQLSLALTIPPLEDADYRKAQERGFTLEQVPVAIDGSSCFVHPDISIPGLSLDQLKDIYKGKITNWKDVGGPNLPIVPFRTNAGSTLKMLMGSEANSDNLNVKITRDFTEMLRKVGSTPGAIGTGTASLIVGQSSIRPVALSRDNSKNYIPPITDSGQLNAAAFRDGTYPLTRRMFIVIRRDGTLEETAGVAYTNLLLSKEGQQFVKKAGFVPIRTSI